MARTKKVTSSDSHTRKMRPAVSPEVRESRMISLAMDLVEERLVNGTATSQEIVHFLKLGSMREQQEREKMDKEMTLLEAKVEALQSAQRVEELYREAMNAFKIYSGHGEEEAEDVDY